jgi:2-keto-4-pentenoate hydratase/2-oxohepta-3-ene-1,7-dioic acid hydratase in catechol pathway
MSNALKLFRTPAGWIVETATGSLIDVVPPTTGLQSGDDIRITIEQIGTLQNTVA